MRFSTRYGVMNDFGLYLQVSGGRLLTRVYVSNIGNDELLEANIPRHEIFPGIREPDGTAAAEFYAELFRGELHNPVIWTGLWARLILMLSARVGIETLVSVLYIDHTIQLA